MSFETGSNWHLWFNSLQTHTSLTIRAAGLRTCYVSLENRIENKNKKHLQFIMNLWIFKATLWSECHFVQCVGSLSMRNLELVSSDGR